MNRDQRNEDVPGDLTTGRKKDYTLLISGYMIDQSYS